MNLRNTTNIQTQYCLQIYFPLKTVLNFFLTELSMNFATHKVLSDKVDTHKYHHPTRNCAGLGQCEFSFSQDTLEFPLLWTGFQFDMHRWVRENCSMHMESFLLVCCWHPQKSPAIPLNPLIFLLNLILLHKYPLEVSDSTCCLLKAIENSLHPEKQK